MVPHAAPSMSHGAGINPPNNGAYSMAIMVILLHPYLGVAVFFYESLYYFV
jgi:hypothetical protein